VDPVLGFCSWLSECEVAMPEAEKASLMQQVQTLLHGSGFSEGLVENLMLLVDPALRFCS
jgi:hypothetical protein